MSKSQSKMQDLSKLPQLQKALAEIVTESDVDNGTTGMEFLAYWYATEFISDTARNELNAKIARAVIGGTAAEVIKLQEELEKLGKPEIMMEWKLINPIPHLKGTKQKVVTRNEKAKRYGIEMQNVTSIFISQKVSDMKLLQWEETDEVRTDSQGRETKVLRMVLNKGLIDVAAPIIIRKKEVRGKRAYVVPISYKSMQVVGTMLFREQLEDQGLTGFDEIM